MRKATTVTVALLAAGALLALGLAIAALTPTSSSALPSASTSEETHESTTEEPSVTNYQAALGKNAEVPKPKGVSAKAVGAFKVALTDDHGSYSIKWTLTFRNLTGKATAAHIHRGKPGKAGPVLVALCGPCRSGRTGNTAAAKPVVDAMKAKAAYVNVHTAKNKAGEIRGQLALK